MSYHSLRRELLEICRQLPASNLATGSTGNISALDGETGHVVIKCSSVPYSVMTEEDFALIDLDGRVIESRGGKKPSFETPTHLAIYKTLPEAKAVLHVHIAAAIVLAASQEVIQSHVTPTGRRLLRQPLPVIPFVENGTEEMARAVVEPLKRGHVGVVIRNHGPFLVGDSPKTVFDRAVALRDVCEMYYQMLLIGKPSLVPPAGGAPLP